MNQTIKRKGIKKIASLFGSWEKYTGVPGLNLTPGQTADVRDFTHNVYEYGNIKSANFIDLLLLHLLCIRPASSLTVDNHWSGTKTTV